MRQLSKQFLDLDAEIRVLPGSTKARNRIVSASLEYLGRLASETRRSLWGTVAGQDMDLALEIGTAYLKVARVQGPDQFKPGPVQAGEARTSQRQMRSWSLYWARRVSRSAGALY